MNSSFTVFPMSQRASLEPGKTFKGKISIANPVDATEDFAYKVSVTPYNVVGEDYAADLTTEYARSKITDWIKIEEPSGTVSPNDVKEVWFTITVPEDAPAGGQYATIVVSSDRDEQATSGVAVQNVFEMASIVYGNVAGEIVQDGEILENNIPGFSAIAPLKLSALISNNGNVHSDATFVISVSDMFTGNVILPTEENEGQYNEIIMPETTKYIEREVSSLPAIGVVKVTQKIYYQGDLSVQEKNVILCPIWFIALVVLTLAAIVTAIVLTVKKHKKKKRSA